MLTPTLRNILERAASEAGFRDRLVTKPDEALAAYSLTTEEAIVMHSLSSEQLAQLAAELGSLEGELTEDDLEKVAAGVMPTSTDRAGSRVC